MVTDKQTNKWMNRKTNGTAQKHNASVDTVVWQMHKTFEHV